MTDLDALIDLMAPGYYTAFVEHHSELFKGAYIPAFENAHDDVKAEVKAGLRGALKALDEAGLAVVPVKPTETMVSAGCNGVDQSFSGTKDVTFEQSMEAALQAAIAAGRGGP